eukprot:6185243-Pleurochrysis_carterae.AAC.8
MEKRGAGERKKGTCATHRRTKREAGRGKGWQKEGNDQSVRRTSLVELPPGHLDSDPARRRVACATRATCGQRNTWACGRARAHNTRECIWRLRLNLQARDSTPRRAASTRDRRICWAYARACWQVRMQQCAVHAPAPAINCA